MATHTAMAQGSNASMRSSLELHLGIIHFVSTKEHGWSGQSRTSNPRELARTASQGATTPSSTQKHSQSDEPKSTVGEDKGVIKSQELPIEKKANTLIEEPPKDSITESDKNTLVDLVGRTTADELIAFYAKIVQNSKAAPKAQGDVILPTISNKSQRSRVHGKEIRRIFDGKIETTTGPNDSIKATASRGGSKQRGNRSADASGRNNRQNLAQGGSGPYLHFSLYKENKDTMDALNHMAKTLRIHPKAFGAAGTKDRRAVTVQRVSIKGRNPNSLVVVNERINNIKIGDFKYAQDPIRLNDHDGNEFVIVLKNCVFSGTENLCFDEKLSVAKSTIDSALTQVIQHGFINYYGTQRFGTHQIGTQEVGMKILKDDFAGAIQALLSYDPFLLHDSQDQDHAKGAHKEDINPLDYLPPRCHVEKTVIQHLGKNSADFVGALMSINRSMRTMYGHAYQSLVWNFVASKRWERFGAQVINGDLVLVKSKSAAALRTNDEERDTEGSVVWEEDIAATQNSGFVPHAVTEDDLHDRKYSIYDVVLPSPGWDIIYPPNEIGDFYAEFMGTPENGGLDPYNMRRRQRDFSLPGSYRKLMAKLKRVPTASVQPYSNDLEQLLPTDLDIIRSRKAKEAAERDARQQSAATSWNTFTQNVQKNELEESRVRVAHREVEDPTPSARVNDTWVQTSVDGSNKRIKIAKHTNICGNEATSIDMDGGDLMQVEDSTQGGKPAEIDVNAAVVSRRERNHEAQDQQLAHKSLASSIIAAVTAQVRAIKNSFLKAIHQVMTFLRMTTNRTSTKPTHDEFESRPDGATPQPPSNNSAATTTVETNNPVPQTTSTSNTPHLNADADSNQVAPRPQLASDAEDLQLGPTPMVPIPVVVADMAESTKTVLIASADSADTNKIAVILRFALDTSQYATMVIRELQGAPAVNNNFAQALNSLSPNENLVDSA
ncbi:hypothetical protein E0Z10_g8662 [Xylaria hypoxylon]|uniref:TRUD domain-containing protein n=1 Tax=Xylaria hypoxylon TaxID=37992 RepID=A0A4Z0YMA2_9PEZI|nr:hypothetical protein E0Z10_g8662 [Xylaria hypoxylon]